MAQKLKTRTRLTTQRDDTEAADYLLSIALAELRRRYPGTEPSTALVRRTGAGLGYYFTALDTSITLQASIVPDAAQCVRTPDVLPTDPYLSSAEAEQAETEQEGTIPA